LRGQSSNWSGKTIWQKRRRKKKKEEEKGEEEGRRRRRRRRRRRTTTTTTTTATVLSDIPVLVKRGSSRYMCFSSPCLRRRCGHSW